MVVTNELINMAVAAQEIAHEAIGNLSAAHDGNQTAVNYIEDHRGKAWGCVVPRLKGDRSCMTYLFSGESAELILLQCPSKPIITHGKVTIIRDDDEKVGSALYVFTTALRDDARAEAADEKQYGSRVAG